VAVGAVSRSDGHLMPNTILRWSPLTCQRAWSGPDTVSTQVIGRDRQCRLRPDPGLWLANLPGAYPPLKSATMNARDVLE